MSLYSPTKTDNEAVDKNLRDLADAIEKLVRILEAHGVDTSQSAPIGAKARTSITVPTT